MIQDLKSGIYHNEYREQGPVAGDYIIFAKGRSMLVKKESETIVFPRFEEIASEMVYIYLFEIVINGKIQKFFSLARRTWFLTVYETTMITVNRICFARRDLIIWRLPVLQHVNWQIGMHLQNIAAAAAQHWYMIQRRG